jgi:hypothetical protein
MASAWHSSHLTGQAPAAASRHFARPRRRTKWASPEQDPLADEERTGPIKEWVVVLLPVVVIVAVCSAGVTLVSSWGRSFDLGFGFDLGQLPQVLDIGGTAAGAAAYVAASQPSHALSVSALNADLPTYKWVVGATSVPPSSPKGPIVGVNIVGTDIETAVQASPGLCSFGLSVTSSADPLIVEDHLPGPGTYSQISQRSQCVANQAPTSSWIAWARTP